jgi:hypothetical protein
MTARRMLVLFGLLILFGTGYEGSPPGPAPGTPAPGTGTPRPTRTCHGALIISGILDPTGTTLQRLDPVRCVSRQSAPVPNQSHGAYVVETAYADGRHVTTYFDALIADDTGRTIHGFFETVQPVDGDVTEVRVATSDISRVFAQISASDIVMG